MHSEIFLETTVLVVGEGTQWRGWGRGGGIRGSHICSGLIRQHRALHGPSMPAYDMPNPCTVY
jgi:hypothetical protein